MDLSKSSSDNIDVAAIGQAAAGVIKAGSGLAKGIRDKAKAKKAQKISDSGGYFQLTAYQKSLIPVPDYARVQAQATGNVVNGSPDQPVINDSGQVDIAKAPALPATDEQLGMKLKAYLPFILIGAGLILFLILRKR